MRKRFNVLIDLIEKHSFTNMVEIGIGKGECTKEILDTIVPSYLFVYYGIDPYKQYEDYNTDINSSAIRLINNQNSMENNTRPFNHTSKGRFVHFKLLSIQACYKFKKGIIDLLFIDGNHSYKYVKQDLESYWSKVKVGGVIAVHDYIQRGANFPGVKQAVDEFVKDKGLMLNHDADVVYFYKLPITETKC